MDIAKRLNRKFYRIQGTGDMTVDDLLGGWSAKDGSTYKEMGPLPLAMGFDGEPGLLIVDEATAIPSEVLFELHAVLEGAPLVIKKFRGMTIEPKPGFGVMINDNTIGQAEANEYVGTNMMNEAFRDRFLFLDYDYMPKDRELKAVTMGIDRFTSEWVKEATPEQVKAVVTESNEFVLSPESLAKIRKAMGLKKED
jgi:cobaltochelatase CobS